MYHNRVIRRQGGFTIIELMLAMLFVSFILVFISLAVTQMMRTYSKGTALKQVNQAGRTIVDDISRAVHNQLPSKVVTTNVAQGVLCVGDAKYVWNPVYSGATIATATYNAAGIDRFRYAGVGGLPVTLARLSITNPSDNCSIPSAPITKDSANYALLGDQARVIWAGVVRSAADSRLMKLSFVIGTYNISDRPGFSPIFDSNLIFDTPYRSGTKLTCRVDEQGNFCGFAEFSTVLYIANEEGS